MQMSWKLYNNNLKQIIWRIFPNSVKTDFRLGNWFSFAFGWLSSLLNGIHIPNIRKFLM